MKRLIISSIKSKIILILIISIAVIFIFSGLTINYSTKIMTDIIAKNNVTLAMETMDKIDLYILSNTNTIKNLALNGQVIEALNKSNAQMSAVSDKETLMLEKTKLWGSGNEMFTQIEGTSLSKYLKEVYSSRSIIELGYRVFGEVFICNEYGEVIAGNNKTSDYLQNDEIWWNEAMKKGIYFSDIKYDDSASVYGIEIAFAIKQDNRNIGVVKGILDISKLIEETKIGLRTDSRFTINMYTREGSIIYSTDIFKFLENYSHSDSFPEDTTEQSGYFTNKDKSVLHSFSVSRGLRLYDGFQWVLIVSQNIDSAFRPIKNYTDKTYLILLFITLLGAAGTAYIINSIIKPLSSFKNGANQIADGNLDYSFHASKNEELVSLANAFNLMIIQLKKSYSDLEKKEKEALKLTKDLKIKNTELEQFAYIASHDLKEPLRKIIAYGGLLSDEYSSKIKGDGVKYISVMENAALRMNNLLSNLLTYSRIESRGKEFSKTPLEDIVLDVLSNLEIQILETDAKILYDTLPVIYCDKIQMTQVFQNLLSNSIKFKSPERQPEIEITWINKDKKKNPIVTVKDNGIGFDMDYKEEIFKPFRKLHSASEFEGTGIGLAICRKIINRHSGEITVDSKLGIETVFTLKMKE